LNKLIIFVYILKNVLEKIKLKSTKDTDRERALCASSAGQNVHLTNMKVSDKQGITSSNSNEQLKQNISSWKHIKITLPQMNVTLLYLPIGF